MSDIVARAQAALEGVTKGPWDIVSGAWGNVWHFSEAGVAHPIVTMGRMKQSDSEFIAAARSLVPELVAELKAARAEAERLRVEFDNYTTWAEHELDAAHGGER